MPSCRETGRNFYMKWVAWSCLLIALSSGPLDAKAADVPKFKDYPADLYVGPEVPIKLDNPQARQYKTQLKRASAKPINFAGQYVFTHWGTGAQCQTGALIDVKTGQVHFLPFAACNWAGFDKPFEVRPNSRLFVVAGQVDNQGTRGAHFYEFTGTDFKKVTRNKDGFFAKLFNGVDDNAIKPAAGPTETAPINKDELWKRNWEIANHKPFSFVFLCYSATFDTMKMKLIDGLGDQFERHFVMAGGNSETAEVAIALCDKDIRQLTYFDDESVYADASYTFRTLAAIMDVRMLSECESTACKEVAKVVFEEGK